MRRSLATAPAGLLRILAAFGVMLALIAAAAVQGRAGFKTTLFVLQVLQAPVKPQSWFTQAPVREVVKYPVASGTAEAHVYRLPDGKPRAAAVLALGVAPLGFDDPDAVNLGEALARAGIVVMYHWSPSMGQHSRIEPDQIDNIVSAFEYLEEQPYVDRSRVAIGGFCVGASFALVAASNARIRERVLVIFVFGPYFDAKSLVLESASREVVFEGHTRQWQPDEMTIKVLANEYIRTLESPWEAELLSRKYLEGELVNPEDLERLSSEAQGIMCLLDGVPLPQAKAIFAGLPDRFHDGISKISPESHISGIRGRMLVMHDRDDNVVPAAESRRLVQAVKGLVDVRYTEFVAFDHVTPRNEGISGLARQGTSLYRHLREILKIAS